VCAAGTASGLARGNIGATPSRGQQDAASVINCISNHP
jgi:hypothetical protein